MKKVLLLLWLFIGVSTMARAGSPCATMGQKNPHGMGMTVSKVWVVDSANFMVSSVKALPFNLGMGDTIWFDVCLLAHDGKMHSTQINYMTNMGSMSYAVSQMAPMGTCQIVSEKNPHPMDITVKQVWVDDSVDFSVSAPQHLPYVVKNGAMVSFNLCLSATDGLSHTARISFATDMGTFTTNPVTMSSSTAAVNLDPVKLGDLSVFPNPASTVLTALLPEGETEGQVLLYTLSGNVLSSTEIAGAKSIEIPVANLPTGAYFLRLSSTKGAILTREVRIVR